MASDGTRARISTLAPTDLDAVAGLVGRACDLDDLPAALLRRRLLDDPDGDPSLLLGAWSGDRLVGVAAGVVRGRPAERIGHVRLLAVEPDARRRGIASALLDELEARLARAGATRLQLGGENPGFIHPGVEVGYTAALCLFQGRGYRMTHETSNMAVDLTAGDFAAPALEERLAGLEVVVRRVETEDRPTLDAYLAENWSASWRVEMLETLDADPPTGFIALRGPEIVAFAAYGVARPSWFGPTGTNESERGRGIGAALLLRCLDALRAAGHPRAEICWTNVWPFYAKVADARICRWYWQMEKATTP